MEREKNLRLIWNQIRNRYFVVYCHCYLNNCMRKLYSPSQPLCGGVVASWLVRSTQDRLVWVRALAGVLMLCSWARHFTRTVLLFLHPVVQMVTLRWISISFMLRKPELSALPIGHLGLYKGFTFFFFFRNRGFQLFDLITQRILSPCYVTRPNIDCEGDNASLWAGPHY